MIALSHFWVMELGLVLAATALGYSVVASWAVWFRPSDSYAGSVFRPKVSVLKPLCGAEAETYECLRSFCDQDYADFEIIFGIADVDDPAVAVARRLKREFASRSIQVVIDRRQHGSNRKVSNLLNMMTYASHEILVLSDSDVRVSRDYLSRLVAPLADGNVGIVTCRYRGFAREGVWSLMGALFINEWFLPSVCVAAMGGSRAFAFGATIALRRGMLAEVGGFEAIADQLADDYKLGELARLNGLQTVLSDMVVETLAAEKSFRQLVHHELRWLRTIRALRPWSYAFCFVTFSVPVAGVGACLAGGAAPAVALLVLTVIARMTLHFQVRPPKSPVSHVLILPFRDSLSLGLWLWSFATRRVHWRDDQYQVNRDGSVQRIAGA